MPLKSDFEQLIVHLNTIKILWKWLDKKRKVHYNPICCRKAPRGRGGIGIRARLRGVFLTEYGFKSRRPHQKGIIACTKWWCFFMCKFCLKKQQNGLFRRGQNVL